MSEDHLLTAMRTELQELEESIAPQRDAIREAEERIERLRQAIAVYKGGNNKDVRAAGRSGTARRPPRARISAEDARTVLLETIQANPGRDGSYYNQSLGVSPATLSKRLDELLQHGVIRREGERRATKYFPT